MISSSFPVSGDDFVNRHEILRRLSLAYQRRQNVALVGPRRIGKTSIAKEFFRRIKRGKTVRITFDVQENLGTPARFVLRIIKLLIVEYLKISQTYELIPLMDAIEITPSNLPNVASQLRSKTLDGFAKFLIAYYPPSTRNERVVLEQGLKFLDEFAQEKDINVMVVLDEFQSIRSLEKNLGRGENVLALLQGIISSSKRSWYLFTGSAVRLMTEILEDADSPFYGRVERIDVGGFTKEDMISLVNRAISKPISGEAAQLLWTLTRGNPYYIVVITNRANVSAEKKTFVVKKDIERGFIEAVTAGELNSHCHYIYDISVGRAESPNVLKEIMKFLSAGPASPTEMANSLGKDRGFISPYIRDLLNLSLVEKTGSKYNISDYILKVWLAGVYGFSDPYIERIEKNINHNYQESLALLKKQRGYLFESYIREMLRKFNNTKFNNRLLPKFETVESLNIHDDKGEVFGRASNVEVDAL
jgi:AAA+ ATPase superfamily predicted ATPase